MFSVPFLTFKGLGACKMEEYHLHWYAKPLLPLACSSSQFSISSLFVLDCAIDLCFRRVSIHVHSKLGCSVFSNLCVG